MLGWAGLCPARGRGRDPREAPLGAGPPRGLWGGGPGVVGVLLGLMLIPRDLGGSRSQEGASLAGGEDEKRLIPEVWKGITSQFPLLGLIANSLRAPAS